MHSQTNNTFNNIEKYLKRVKSYYTRNLLLTALSLFLSYLLIGSILISILFAFLIPSNTSRLITLSLFFISGIIIFFLRWSKELWTKNTLRNYAIRLEKCFPSLNSKLITAYDLNANAKEQLGYSISLIDRATNMGYKAINDIDYKAIFSSDFKKKAIRKLWSSIALVLIGLIIIPDTLTFGFELFANPLRNITKPPETYLVIQPSEQSVVKFSDFKIDIKTYGVIPNEVKLFRIGKTNSEIDFTLEPDSSGYFSYVFRKVYEPIRYYLVANDYISDIYTVQVLDLPKVLSFQATIIPPSYTGLSSQPLATNDGMISALYGSNAKFSIKLSKKIKEGYFIFDDSSRVPLTSKADSAWGSFRVNKEGNYSMIFYDYEGNSNPSPITYSISYWTDNSPSIRLLSPEGDIDLDEDMTVPLLIVG